MAFFQKVEGDAAIIVENGVYKQVDLYTRDGHYYVATGGGFLRLFADGSTTKAKCRLDFLSLSGELLYKDSLGRLCTPDAGGTLLEQAKAVKLLGGPNNG